MRRSSNFTGVLTHFFLHNDHLSMVPCWIKSDIHKLAISESISPAKGPWANNVTKYSIIPAVNHSPLDWPSSSMASHSCRGEIWPVTVDVFWNLSFTELPLLRVGPPQISSPVSHLFPVRSPYVFLTKHSSHSIHLHDFLPLLPASFQIPAFWTWVNSCLLGLGPCFVWHQEYFVNYLL